MNIPKQTPKNKFTSVSNNVIIMIASQALMAVKQKLPDMREKGVDGENHFGCQTHLTWKLYF
jgi:hypothetical protein